MVVSNSDGHRGAVVSTLTAEGHQDSSLLDLGSWDLVCLSVFAWHHDQYAHRCLLNSVSFRKRPVDPWMVPPCPSILSSLSSNSESVELTPAANLTPTIHLKHILTGNPCTAKTCKLHTERSAVSVAPPNIIDFLINTLFIWKKHENMNFPRDHFLGISLL